MSEPGFTEETIFIGARQFSHPEERAAYLDNACGGDRALRERVERMLKAEQKADQFLATDPLRFERTVAPPENRLEAEGATLGSYKLLQQIGEGGCGIVFMADQEQPIRRRVALKVIKPGMDTRQVVARFEAERQALAMMDHPNIARVLDAGTTENGRPFFVMELVRGIRITDYCDQNNLPTHARLDLFTKVVQAVQHAHQKGIIHRDLKPSNVLVTLLDGVPVPKVIDFGIAKALEQKLTDKTLFTRFEQFIGTPSYTSPEQVEMSGLDIDTRSDIYSLGVLLYELLVGKTPFDAQELLQSGLDEMRRIIREKEPNRPSTRLSTMLAEERTTTAEHRAVSSPELIHLLNGDLDWIVMKCLEKDRTRRYDTANALGSDIEHYLNNEPVTARPPNRLYRLGKLVRRNQLAFAAGASVAVALVAGIAVSTWQAVRAHRAEHIAKEEKESAEAVLKFVRDRVLAAGRPEGKEGGLGKDVTLRQAIEAAETQISDAFKDRPLVEAAIRQTIGESYGYLGEPSSAVQQLERALELRRQSFGHLDSSTLNLLHVAYLSMGRPDRMLPLYEEALTSCKTRLGQEHPDTLSAMNNLGLAYSEAGKHDQGAALLEQTLQLRKARLGRDAPGTLVTMSNLAMAYQGLGRWDEAETLLEEALGLSRTTLGADHHETLNTMNTLAVNHAKAGKYDQFLALAEELVELSKTKLGAEHPDTLKRMNELGSALGQAGRHDDALALLEKIHAVQTAKLGPMHPDTRHTATRIGVAAVPAQKYELALPLLKEAVQNMKAMFGPDDFATLQLMASLAGATEFASSGSLDQALPIYEETFRRMKATNHGDVRVAMNNLIAVYRAAGKYEEAEALCRECLRQQNHDQAATFGLARVLLDRAKTDGANPARARERVVEAGQLLRDALVLARSHHTHDAAKLCRSLDESADLYREMGRFDEASALYQESLALKNDGLAATLGLARTFLEWANSDVTSPAQAQARRERGLVLTSDYLAKARSRHAHDPAKLERSLYDLADLCHRQDLYPQAERLYREILQRRRARLGSEHTAAIEATADLARLFADWAWVERDSTSASREPITTTADRAREAERLLRECLAAHLNRTNQTPLIIAEMRSRLGGALVSIVVADPALDAAGRESQLAEAEPLLLAGSPHLRENKSAQEKHKRDAVERIVRLYEAWDKPDKRAEWQQRLDAFGTAKVIR